MKVIESICGSIELQQFPPGYYYTPEENFVQYYKVKLNYNIKNNYFFSLIGLIMN